MTAHPHSRFRSVLVPGRSSGRDRLRIGRRLIYGTLAVVVAFDVLILLAGPDGARSRGSRTTGDLVQQVSVTIQELDPATGRIRVAGDLVGIMGADVIVTPQTWIGIDRQLAVFGQLRDGLRANIAFVRQGEKRIARWIQATTSRSDPVAPPEPAPAPATAPVASPPP